MLAMPIAAVVLIMTTQVQRAFNDVYKTFNATQLPVIIADFIVPKGTPIFRARFQLLYAVITDSLDVNVSPDKRTIFIHSEDNLIQALKVSPLTCSVTRLLIILLDCP